MAKRGRKPFNVEEHIDEVEDLAAQGLNDSEICYCLGIHKATLYKYKRKKNEFNDAIKRGRARCKRDLTNVLFVAATKEKKLAAAMFLLKTQFGYRETGPVIPEGPVDDVDISQVVYNEIDGRIK